MGPQHFDLVAQVVDLQVETYCRVTGAGVCMFKRVEQKLAVHKGKQQCSLICVLTLAVMSSSTHTTGNCLKTDVSVLMMTFLQSLPSQH